MGITPHSDASIVSILMQYSDTDGLQIPRDGRWVPIKPVPGALVVNLGDVVEVTISNRRSLLRDFWVIICVRNN